MYYEFDNVIPGSSNNLTKIGLTKMLNILTRSIYFFFIYGPQNMDYFHEE